MVRGNSRIARAGPSLPGSSSSPAVGGRQKLITGRIPGVDKDVSRIIYGTLFLHTFENDEACFDLLEPPSELKSQISWKYSPFQ